MLQLRERLIGIRELEGLGLRLERRRVRAPARRRGRRRRARFDARRNRGDRYQRGGYRAARGSRRREHEYLPDADHIDVFDVVPCRELAVVESVIERNLIERVATFDRIGRLRRCLRRGRRPALGRWW